MEALTFSFQIHGHFVCSLISFACHAFNLAGCPITWWQKLINICRCQAPIISSQFSSVRSVTRPNRVGVISTFLSWFCFLHVGCTMHDEEWLSFFLDPRLMLAIGCNFFFSKLKLCHNGAIMVDLLMATQVVYVIFDVELALTCQTMLLHWFSNGSQGKKSPSCFWWNLA